MLNAHIKYSVFPAGTVVKPARSVAPKHASIASSQVHQDLQRSGEVKRGKNFPSEDEVMTLAELVEKYANLIPLCFRVTMGFLAENDKDPTIYYYDLYNVHLVKRAEFVVIQDKRGDQYKIPLYSAVKFGVVYKNAATRVFNSVQDIMDAVPLPKVVTATSNYVSANPKSSVQKNEVLVITKVKKPKFGHGKSSLKAFSVTLSKKKKLAQACDVKFTTKPKYTQLYVTELLKHIPDLLPCKVKLFLDSENLSVSLPEHLTRESVVLRSRGTDTSIVVSLVSEDTKQQQREFIDLPTTVGVMGYVVSPDEVKDVYEQLYSETDGLAKNFDPTKLQPCVDARNDDTYVTQAALLAAIRKGHSKVGWEIQSSLCRPNQYYRPLESTENYEESNGVEDVASNNVNECPSKSGKESINPFSMSPILRPKGTCAPLRPVEVSTDETTDTCRRPKPVPKPRTNSLRASFPTPEPIYVSSFNSTATWTPLPVANGNSHKTRRTQCDRLPSHQCQQLSQAAQSGPLYEDLDEVHEETAYWNKFRVYDTCAPEKFPIPLQVLQSTNKVTEAHMQNRNSKIRNQGEKLPIPELKPKVTARHKLPATTARLSFETAKSKVFEQQLLTIAKSHNSFERPSVPPFKPRVPVRPMSVGDNAQSVPVTPTKPDVSPPPVSSKEQSHQLKTSDLVEFKEFECTDERLPDSLCKDLTQLGPNEIVRLLEAMQLDQYKEAFKDELIDGEIFAELDEDVLAEELGVTVKIHRLRLMKVITGKVSARAVLDGSVLV